jgi:hypothetical protein
LLHIFSLSGDITDLPSLVRRAVSALQVTPDLFQSCTRDIVASRRSGMLRRFVSAVQEGPAAIELHAGDVLRHVALFPQFIFVTSTQVHGRYVRMATRGDRQRA